MKITSGTDKEKAEQKTVLGISIRGYAWHTTVNTAFAALPFDWSQIIPDVKYIWGKSKLTVMENELLPVLLDNTFQRGEYKMVHTLGTEYIPVLVAAAGGVDEVAIPAVNLLFNHPVNCTKGRMLEMAMKVQAGFYAATCDTASSYVEIDFIEGEGHDPYVPQFSVDPIVAAESSKNYNIGSFVEEVGFVNTDKVGITSAVQVLQSAQIKSNIFDSDVREYNKLYSERQQLFVDPTDADFRNQSFKLHKANGALLHGTQAVLKFVSANVNSGKNYIVTTRAFVNKELNDLYAAVEREHARENSLVQG